MKVQIVGVPTNDEHWCNKSLYDDIIKIKSRISDAKNFNWKIPILKRLLKALAILP